MTNPERLKVFGIGFALGCVILMILSFFKQRAIDQREDGPPAYMVNVNNNPYPIDAPWVVDQQTYPAPKNGGPYRRAVVFEGKTAGQMVRIVETIEPAQKGPDLVTQREWMEADRVQIKLAPTATAQDLAPKLRQQGYQLMPNPGNPDWFYVKLPNHQADALSQALAELPNLPGITKARPLTFHGD